MPRRILPIPNDRSQYDGRTFARYLRSLRRPRRSGKNGRHLDDGGVPVEPNKPRDLSGGAAAALEFDE
jgi:hypothetical protein